MQHAGSHKDVFSDRTLVLAVAASLLVHLITAKGLNVLTYKPQRHYDLPVKVRIAEPRPKEMTKDIPAPPKKRERPRKETLAPNQQPTTNTPVTDVPVQGLTKDSLSNDGTMAAPVGNTLMTEDVGKRLKDVDALRGDMSAPARLIASTMIIPPYTDDALEAGIEGSYIVDVYVNLDGSVRDAELRKKIGLGMDARVLEAVRGAKFIPRKNKLGVSEEGWTELKFTLVIP